MRYVLGLCFILLTSIAARAQSTPIIEYFTVDNDALSYPRVEAGVEAANFSWRAVGLRQGDRMQMHALVGGQWALIGEDFEAEKTDRLVIAHPLDFIPPTYRLSVVDAGGEIVAEAFLELHYAPPEGLPRIAFFLPFNSRNVVSPDVFDEPFRVHWRVDNRWFNSNIVIEQVLPDGTAINVEFDRPNEWQYAYRADYVQPVYPGDHEDVVLRLRVVNRDDDSTLAQSDIVLHVDNIDIPQAEVVNFSVSPSPVEPGGTVTVTWEVINTDAVWIQVQNGPPTGVYPCGIVLTVGEDLPPSGSLDIAVPETNYSHLQIRLFADFYIAHPGRGEVGSFCPVDQEPTAEIVGELTDYPGLGVVHFDTVQEVAISGDTITLTWEVRRGESVTIRTVRPGFIAAGYALTDIPYIEAFSDLPLSGTLEVVIPDSVTMRTMLFQYYVLYINDSPEFPLMMDGWASISLDRDRNLDCVPSLDWSDVGADVSEIMPPGTELTLTWDSCGLQPAVLELVQFGPNPSFAPVVYDVDPSGTMSVTLPDIEGRYGFRLYYEYEGERIWIVASRFIELIDAQG